MIGTGREDARDDAFGQCAAALILFFDDEHTRADFDVTAFGDAHGCRVQKIFKTRFLQENGF